MYTNTAKHKTELKINFGELRPIIEWCKDNCCDHWGYSVLYPAGKTEGDYEFYFDGDTDYINFILYFK